MTEPFLGNIQYFAFNYAPRGWHICDGSTLPINQYQALFALIGTYYGGNGSSNFKLPDLRGQTIVGQNPSNSSYSIGNKGGSENVIVPANALPLHTHTVTLQIGANNAAGAVSAPTGAYPAMPKNGTLMYAATSVAGSNLGAPTVTVATAGAGAPFSSLSPYLALTCCIAMTGIFPSRS